MDFEPLDEKSTSPYRDYYSTDGCYRPPKQPRNRGWMLAAAGVLLLCLALATAVGRRLSQEGNSTVKAAETTLAETAVSLQETAAPTAAMEPLSRTEEDGAESEVRPGDARLQVDAAKNNALELTELYKKVIPSVASITALGTRTKSTGTGIVMSADGYIITNFHVVSGAQSVSVLLSDERELPARIVGGDETSDLAVLLVDAEDLTPAEFGSSDTAEVGQSVVAIGDPLGTELRGTMTDGIICGIHRSVQVGDRTMALMQTNAALNSGNSGGPLVNMAGQVIGINTMKMANSYANVEGIGFAIPISDARPIIDELIEKGYVAGRPAFGFTVEALSLQMRLFYNLPGAIYIRSVVEGSDAAEKGILPGDIIIAVNDTEVGSLDEFNSIKNQCSAGDEVTLIIFRKGEQYKVTVTLMDRADVD